MMERDSIANSTYTYLDAFVAIKLSSPPSKSWFATCLGLLRAEMFSTCSRHFAPHVISASCKQIAGFSCHTVSFSPFIFFLAFVSCTVSMTGHGRYDRDASCASHRVLPSISLFTIPLLRRLVVCRGGEVPFLPLNGTRKVPPSTADSPATRDLLQYSILLPKEEEFVASMPASAQECEEPNKNSRCELCLNILASDFPIFSRHGRERKR